MDESFDKMTREPKFFFLRVLRVICVLRGNFHRRFQDNYGERESEIGWQ